MKSGGRGAQKDLFLSLFILNWFISFIDVFWRTDVNIDFVYVQSSHFLLLRLWYRVGFRLVMFSGYKSSEESILRNSSIHSY